MEECRISSVMLIFLLSDTCMLTSSAALETAREQLISAAPPPYTTRLSRTRFLTAQMASCRERLASSMIYVRSERFSTHVGTHNGRKKKHISYHLVATTYKHGNGSRVGTLFNNQHSVLGGAE